MTKRPEAGLSHTHHGLCCATFRARGGLNMESCVPLDFFMCACICSYSYIYKKRNNNCTAKHFCNVQHKNIYGESCFFITPDNYYGSFCVCPDTVSGHHHQPVPFPSIVKRFFPDNLVYLKVSNYSHQPCRSRRPEPVVLHSAIHQSLIKNVWIPVKPCSHLSLPGGLGRNGVEWTSSSRKLGMWVKKANISEL